jgi:NAD(P)-dependent dehydrogenase (short-subunit alcohol dehydrogenase family)
MNRRLKKTLIWTAAGVGAACAARAVTRRLRAISLEGKVAVVTGGSRGLGLVLARELASQGARLALCARDADELDRARRELAENLGADVLALPCDVTEPEQVEAFMRAVLEHYGRIDVLINNAGVIMSGPHEHMTAEDYEHALATHFWGPYHTITAALPELRRNGGRIVNVASVGGKASVPHLLPYCASKFALVGFSEGLRAELAKDGVLVTTVAPGLMRTGSPRNALFKGKHRKEYAMASICDSLPLLSIAAESAARKIVDACRHGDAELTISIPAKLLARFQGLFPGLTADLFGLVDRILPGAGGIGSRTVRGADSASALAPSWITTLGDEAAVRNNEP